MPYSDLPPIAFWRTCREDRAFRVRDLYQPKFQIAEGARIATAGSCFAQNVVPYLQASAFEMVDQEPPPNRMPAEVARRFGYGQFSARFGNIYTCRQMRQLVEDVMAEQVHDCAIWELDGVFYDGLRPGLEPDGLTSADEVRHHRIDHLRRVRQMFETIDVLFFTMGLTETWRDRDTGRVFPTAPGVVAGNFDPNIHEFHNLSFSENLDDLKTTLDLLRSIAPGLQVVLTVSPVPLTATASGTHVLQANTYSKSVLRAVAGEVSAGDPDTDYFPAFEIVTGAPFRSKYFKSNLRNVTKYGIEAVMSVFFAAHGQPDVWPDTGPDPSDTSDEDETDPEVCEEAMLEAFAQS